MDKVLRAFIHSGSSFERSIHRRAQRGKGVGVEREREAIPLAQRSAGLFMETTHQLNYFIVPDWPSTSVVLRRNRLLVRYIFSPDRLHSTRRDSSARR